MKTVLLTGASGGLGLALSQTLLEQGYFVYLHYHHQRKALEALHAKYPNYSKLIQADFACAEDLLRLKEQIDRPLDILINNAAIEHLGPLKEKTMETMHQIFQINTVAPFLLMKQFASEIEKREGSIINISSDNTIDKYDEVTLEYDVSKAGLNLLSKSFARIYPKAKINAICFGWLDTPMNDFPEDIKKDMPFIPLDKAVSKIITYIKTNETGKVDVCQ